VVSLRLKDDLLERLERVARRLGRSPSGTAVLLLEEALRQRDYPFIEFRDSPVGRQAYLKGTRLAVWQVEWLARDYNGDVDKIAAHLDIPAVKVAAALQYAAAYRDEIEAARADTYHAVEELRQFLPSLRVVEVDAASA